MVAKYRICARFRGNLPAKLRPWGRSRGNFGGIANTKSHTNMAYSSYIPAADSEFAVWLANFQSLLAANPTNYGLVAGDAAEVTTVNTAFQAAYVLATGGTTRTSATIAAKDNARAAAEAVVRPFAVQISLNGSVSDALKVGIRVTVRKLVPTPIPAITTAPDLSLKLLQFGQAKINFRDAQQPQGKAKPFGATGLELWQRSGAGTPTEPYVWTYVGNWGKSPLTFDLAGQASGTQIVLRSRFTTLSGPGGKSQPGPWSNELTFAAP